MRELKFRAWDKDVAKYVDGVSELYVDILEVGTKTFRIEQMCPGRYIIEQYTGLKDRNGKEIYEGDIVRYGNDNAAIIWREKNAEFGVKWLDCGVEDSISWQIGIEKTPSEVIGNIHENPELLDEEE